ncbi:MAG TPA: hypothetical protein EYP39_03205 [Ghiorsea sp.]|nr:hypothetical protein [Ghiorsea sp.]
MKVLVLLLSMFAFSWQTYAEETKMNVELTAYIPGLGIEYQIDEKRTLGLNYSAPFASVNVNMTSYNDGVLNGGYFNNVFLGYGQDKDGATGFLNLDHYIYAGAVFGYQWLLDSGINFNADAGLMLMVFDAAGEMNILPIPAFAASVGYAFSIE